ncbi:hypothetical protein OD91_2047 [Lutibacter sp. Hel_I_33_5]|uniref:HYC_CC_PP family protein n=1 Tax=Lutibacter sp. Hel_I_33_5 TaxID=1566289 RepID=UPI0011A9B0FB|nr:hypothetical protein [Lutibacter sp. Hel_I_33_5]TVZ56749.1 hypothetical protein OD91_2047 [Lutibacter sp. Hel_I_33_5]
MKQFSLKISSTLLALLVLFSTFSFAVDKHFCGDFLVDVSYFGDAKGCGMELNKNPSRKKKSCCKDEILKVEGQDELQQFSDIELDLKTKEFAITFLISFQDLFIQIESEKLIKKDFSPPDIPKDFQVAFQAFLI